MDLNRFLFENVSIYMKSVMYEYFQYLQKYKNFNEFMYKDQEELLLKFDNVQLSNTTDVTNLRYSKKSDRGLRGLGKLGFDPVKLGLIGGRKWPFVDSGTVEDKCED